MLSLPDAKTHLCKRVAWVSGQNERVTLTDKPSAGLLALRYREALEKTIKLLAHAMQRLHASVERERAVAPGSYPAASVAPIYRCAVG